MSFRILVANNISGERRYLAGSGHGLGLGRRDHVCLIHRGSLLTACLPAIVIGAETNKVEKTCQSSSTSG